MFSIPKRWWFFYYVGTKNLLTQVKIRIFGPKTAEICPKYAFLDILGQILAFLFISSHGDQKTMRTRWLGGFSVMWVPKLLLSLVKIRIFCPKKAKFGPKYAFLGT